jgi:dTDP-4-dehydrorhamnose reductase
MMKIVILGTGGRLGAALVREFKDYDVTGFNREQLDLSNLDGLRTKLDPMVFDVLINAAGFTNVDACETERDRAFLINAEAPGVLAKICNAKDAKLIHFSTDYIFDGQKRTPYTEEDEARPISFYGESKLIGEKNVLAGGNPHLVVRVSWVFGPDRPSFIDAMIKRAQENEKVDAIADKFSTPTYTHDIAGMLPQFFDCAVDGGILHFANAGKCSWQQYAQWALDCCRDAGMPLRTTTVGALTLRDMSSWVARRPVYSVLSTVKYTELTGQAPRAWREAVADYIRRFHSKK